MGTGEALLAECSSCSCAQAEQILAACNINTKGKKAALMIRPQSWALCAGAVSEFDPGAVVYAVETMNEVLANSMAARRLSMILLAAFATLALALSCIGMYGVLSYLAGERTREIGVRMALGAQRRDIRRLILGQGVKMALAGVALGIFLALGLTHLMSSQLFGITPHDPLTFACVALVLLLVALAACYFPARRAMGVDPMVALRHE